MSYGVKLETSDNIHRVMTYDYQKEYLSTAKKDEVRKVAKDSDKHDKTFKNFSHTNASKLRSEF